MSILRSVGLVADDSILVWGETFRVSSGLLSEVFLPFIAVLTGNAKGTHYASKQARMSKSMLAVPGSYSDLQRPSSPPCNTMQFALLGNGNYPKGLDEQSEPLSGC